MEYVFKTILIGDKGVGRQTLSQYFQERLEEGVNQIAVSYFTKKIFIKDKEINLQIWNLSNQEEYEFIMRNYCERAHGAIYIFDQSRPGSLNYIKEFMKKEFTPEKTVKIIMGNKSDLDEMINNEVLNGLLGEKIKYFPASTKTGEGINEAFNYLAEEMINKFIKN